MATLFVNDVTVSEADGFADVIIQLDKPSASTVTVAWATKDGTAYDRGGFGYDYVTASGTLSFAPGEVQKMVRISLRDSAAVTQTDIERNEWSVSYTHLDVYKRQQPGRLPVACRVAHGQARCV